MTKRHLILIDCDRCGKQAITDPVSVSVVVGWITCPAGGSGDDDTRQIDLCSKCASTLLQDAVKGLGYEEGAAWLKNARKKP